MIGFIGYYFANQYGLFNKDVKEPREKIKTSSESAADTQSASEDETTSEDVSETTTPMADDVIDVEELVLEIRGKYDKITNGIASNSYDAVIVDDGVMAYADQNKISAIVVKRITAIQIIQDIFTMMVMIYSLHTTKAMIHTDFILITGSCIGGDIVLMHQIIAKQLIMIRKTLRNIAVGRRMYSMIQINSKVYVMMRLKMV